MEDIQIAQPNLLQRVQETGDHKQRTKIEKTIEDHDPLVPWKTEKTVHRNKDLGQEARLKTTQEKTIHMIDLSPDIALKIGTLFNKGPDIMKMIEQDLN